MQLAWCILGPEEFVFVDWKERGSSAFIPLNLSVTPYATMNLSVDDKKTVLKAVINWQPP